MPGSVAEQYGRRAAGTQTQPRNVSRRQDTIADGAQLLCQTPDLRGGGIDAQLRQARDGHEHLRNLCSIQGTLDKCDSFIQRRVVNTVPAANDSPGGRAVCESDPRPPVVLVSMDRLRLKLGVISQSEVDE